MKPIRRDANRPPHSAPDARVEHSSESASPHSPENDSTHSQHAVGDATATWRFAEDPRAQRPASQGLPSIPGYEVVKVLGRGGMGVVLQARDLRLNRFVALKLPLADHWSAGEDRERFLREARAAAKLRHSGICPIYEISEVDGRPYLAMAYIDGEPLSNWAERNPPTARSAAEIVAAIAEAVQAAHDNGVIHRDLKPSNVMIESASQTPILMDFGLAKDQSEASHQLTFDGDVLGTPAYMSPEQAAGRTALIGPLSDVYGLGGILYSLLARRPPFSGTFAAVMRRVQDDSPAPLHSLHPGLHRDLEVICLKAMAKHPSDRYGAAAELAADLRRFGRGEAILARPEPWTRRWRRLAERHRTSLAAAFAVILTMVAAGVVFQQARRERRMTHDIQYFDAELEKGVDAVSQVEALERLVEAWQASAPEQAAQAKVRLAGRFADSLRRRIQRPTLTGEELTELRHALESLAKRAPAVAHELTGNLDQRLRSWQPIVDLRPPFTGLAEYFPKEQLRIDGTDLAWRESFDSTEAAASGEGSSPPTSRILSTIPARGNVEWIVEFPWDSAYAAPDLGVTFHFSPRESYDVMLAHAARAPELVGDEPTIGLENSPTAPDAQLSTSPPAWGRRRELQIRRNGITVRRQAVQRSGNAWELSIRREAGRLTCRVGGAPALIYDDIFPLGQADVGSLGLILPSGARVSRIQAARQLMPTQPSPLEQGDELMSRERFHEAFEQYRLQERDAVFDVVQESRAKQALCLLRLQRNDEAVALLADVSEQRGERWPIIAAAHLWLLRLQQGNFDDAELIRSVLASRYEFDQLASLLPEELRNAVSKEYLKSVQGANLMTFNAERLSQMERVAQAERLVKGRSAIVSLILLLRGYRMLAQDEQAWRLATEIYDSQREAELSQFDRVWLAEEYAWLLRLRGQFEEARSFINQRLEPESGKWNEEWLPLLVERARIEANVGNSAQAERDLETLLQRLPIGRMSYRHYSAARLLQGFLRQERGDSTGAVEAWKSGVYREWHPHYSQYWDAAIEASTADGQSKKRPALPAEHPHLFSGAEFVQFVLLSSLAETLTPEEAKQLFQWITFRLGGAQDTTVKSVVLLLQGDLAQRTFRDVCRTPRGKQVAKDVAYQRIDMHEFVKNPLYLLVYEVARQGAFPQGFSPTQDEIVWGAARTAHDAFLQGRASKSQILGLAFTWKGQTGAFGWDGVAAGLDPPLRSSMAFIFAHRLRNLQRPADAVRLFREAAQYADEGDSLKTEAEREAESLGN